MARTVHRGGSVLRRRVQDRLPAEGRWGTVLLADGNVGIGGDPAGLLRRCAQLLRPGGLLLVEADPDPDADKCGPVVLHCDDGRRSRTVLALRCIATGGLGTASLTTAPLTTGRR